VTEAPAGMPAHAVASVSGSFVPPTGKVIYSSYNNLTCAGLPTQLGQPVDLYNGSAPPSDEVAQTSAGISFKAHYNGDLNYNSDDGECMPLQVGKLVPVLAPNLHNASHEVVTVLPIASMVHDNILVTGSWLAPTGSVTFTLYNRKQDCTGSSSTQTLGLVSGAAESTALRTPNTGLSYRVSYTGDDNYHPAVTDCQPLDFTKLDAVMDFVFHDSGHNSITTAPVGDWVHTSASFSGAAETPTGTVTYSTYNNLSCTDPDALQPVDLDGGGVAHSSSATQVLPSGISVKLHYTGDANYKVLDTDCQPLKMATTTTLTSSTNPHIVGKLVTFTITVTSTAGPVTGPVTLYIDDAPIQLTLNNSGVTTYITRMDTVGDYTLTASYAGNRTFNPSTSPTLVQSITKLYLFMPIVKDKGPD
jgi:hypothetical protein